MKFFLAFALIVAVASAGVIKSSPTADMQQIHEIIAAINSPNTDPATAQLLEQMLYESMGVHPVVVAPAVVEEVSPISVGPAIVEGISPISVGPAIVEGISPVEGAEVAPAPVVEVPVASETQSYSPLVQIIINVIGEAGDYIYPVSISEPAAVVDRPAPAVDAVIEEASPIIPAPVVLPEPVAPVVIEPVTVVEEASPIVPTPVVLPEAVAPVVVEPIQIAEPVLPVVVVEPEVEPIAVGEPDLPISVQPVNVPETLN